MTGAGEHVKSGQTVADVNPVDAAELMQEWEAYLAHHVPGAGPDYPTFEAFMADRRIMDKVAERAAGATGKWQPIRSAPKDVEVMLVAYISGGRLYWAEAGRRGAGALRAIWYSPTGHTIPPPTHWAPAPEMPE